MQGAIHAFLTHDHGRLDALLLRATADPDTVDRAAYDDFRAGLLRHIAMEEKVLLPEARRLRGEPLAAAKRLRADHAVLAALLVPTPTHAILATVRSILTEHNAIEEQPGGVYEAAEQLVGAGADALLARIRAIPEVPVAQHFDGPRAHEAIARLLEAREAVRVR